MGRTCRAGSSIACAATRSTAPQHTGSSSWRQESAGAAAPVELLHDGARLPATAVALHAGAHCEAQRGGGDVFLLDVHGAWCRERAVSPQSSVSCAERQGLALSVKRRQRPAARRLHAIRTHCGALHLALSAAGALGCRFQLWWQENGAHRSRVPHGCASVPAGRVWGRRRAGVLPKPWRTRVCRGGGRGSELAKGSFPASAQAVCCVRFFCTPFVT
jgi:hypothetical protein